MKVGGQKKTEMVTLGVGCVWEVVRGVVECVVVDEMVKKVE